MHKQEREGEEGGKEGVGVGVKNQKPPGATLRRWVQTCARSCSRQLTYAFSRSNKLSATRAGAPPRPQMGWCEISGRKEGEMRDKASKGGDEGIRQKSCSGMSVLPLQHLTKTVANPEGQNNTCGWVLGRPLSCNVNRVQLHVARSGSDVHSQLLRK
jgi:hypothetical protein